MASITIVFSDNGDGSVTITSASVPFQVPTTKSVTQASDIAMGWIKQSIPALLN
jgi:hypothetical protein